MAKQKNDPHDRLDLVDACPPEYEVGDMVGRGPGKGLVFMYRNFTIDFRSAYRVQVDLMANDPTCPFVKHAEKKKKTKEEEPS